MEDLMELIRELKELFTFNITMGFITLIVLYVAVMRWHAKNKLQFKPRRHKDIEKAVNRGHVVEGKMISMWEDTDDGTSTDPMSWVHAKYSYEVDGKSYIYRYMDRALPPDLLTLYYVDNPAKAFRKKPNLVKIFLYNSILHLIPWGTALAVISLLGGVG